MPQSALASSLAPANAKQWSLRSIEGLVKKVGDPVGRLVHPAARPERVGAAELLQVVEMFSRALSPREAMRQLRLGAHGSNATATEDARRFHRFIDTPGLEVWLIEWGGATSLDLHDHGGSSGAVSVLRGCLTETYTDLVSRRPLRRRNLCKGDRLSFGPDHVHEVWNPGSTPALSLHAYSPRLTALNFYGSSARDFLEPRNAAASS